MFFGRAVVAALISMSTFAAAATVLAVTGGRIELSDQPSRRLDTRANAATAENGVTSIEVGSGALTITVLRPADVGTAVIHACDEPAPTDRVTFRLDPSDRNISFTRIFTSEIQCLTSTTPVQVLVDANGTVAESATARGDQYASLPSPVELSTIGVAASETIVIPRPGRLAVDATAAVIALEVLTSTAQTAQGFVTAYGCDEQPVYVADLFYRWGRSANVAAVPLAPGEDLCIFSSGQITLRTTLLGELRPDGPNPDALPPSWSYVPGQVPAPSLRPINPIRRLDTRFGIGRTGTDRLRANETLELNMTEFMSPLTTAISMNVTAVGGTGAGFLTVWPCTPTRPTASNLNFSTSSAVPGLVVSKLSPNGSVCISASSDVHVVVDVNATYEADGGLNAVPVEPERILDTRYAVGTSRRDRVPAGSVFELQVTGAKVPTDAGAATINVTAAASDVDGFITVYPCDEDRPTASNLNFRVGEASPNLVTTSLSATGSVCLYSSQSVHLIADLAAWYGPDRPAGLIEMAPVRVLDTREPIGVSAAGRIAPAEVIELDFASVPNVAADADAVVMNVTAARAAGTGFVTVWPCDQERPTVSNLNIRAERTVANLTTVKLSAAGTVCLAASSETHLIADLAGYLTGVPVNGNALVLGS